MIWSQALVVTVSSISLVYLLGFTVNRHLFIKSTLSIALISFILVFLSPLTGSMQTSVADWSKITAVTFILIFLAALIRELKPVYKRYPFGFLFTPAVLFLVFPVLMSMEVLKELMFQLLQGGALFIILLLSIVLSNQVKKFGLFITGIGCFVASYGIYWLMESHITLNEWAWQLPAAVAIILITSVYNELIDALDRNDV